ncbi:MAG TPA: N-acetyltransferase [Sphingomonas sp.]|uniref:GNAT family N-acetyltransferase n=1 Tax=Sphingomonas sp. TaxID=28214 RepID=UPI002ED839D2
MTNILPLTLVAPSAIERLLDAAFGVDRHARTAYRLRAGVDWIADLSFAALAGDVLVGSVQCWPIALTTPGGETVPLTLLGPVAVDPARQHAGIGQRLTRAAIAAIRAHAAPPPLLIGDPEYYGRFGFVAAPTAGWDLPGPFEPHRLLLLPTPGRVLPTAGMVGPRVTMPGFASGVRMA